VTLVQRGASIHCRKDGEAWRCLLMARSGRHVRTHICIARPTRARRGTTLTSLVTGLVLPCPLTASFRRQLHPRGTLQGAQLALCGRLLTRARPGALCRAAASATPASGTRLPCLQRGRLRRFKRPNSLPSGPRRILVRPGCQAFPHEAGEAWTFPRQTAGPRWQCRRITTEAFGARLTLARHGPRTRVLVPVWTG